MDYSSKDERIDSDKRENLADEIFLYCPELDEGIMIIDQSPTGAVKRLTGGLPEMKFWSSGERRMAWDESLNGKKEEVLAFRPSSFELTSDKPVSLLVNRKKVKAIEGEYNVSTILITFDNFKKVLEQIDSPTYDPDYGNKVIQLEGTLFNLLEQDQNKIDTSNFDQDNIYLDDELKSVGKELEPDDYRTHYR